MTIVLAFTTTGGSLDLMLCVNENRRRQFTEPGKSTESHECSSIEFSSLYNSWPRESLFSSLSTFFARDGDILFGVMSMGADLPNLKSNESLLLLGDEFFLVGVLPIGREILCFKSDRIPFDASTLSGEASTS